jgi:hypothetical protein
VVVVPASILGRAGSGVGPYLFFRGFRLLQLKRLLMDVPRSSIHAAALGPVEMSGKAVGPYTVVSPFSRSNCLYYRVVKRSAGQTNIREMCDRCSWKTKQAE